MTLWTGRENESPGEVALFAGSTAALLYLMHKNGFGKDPVSFAFRFLLGREFAEASTPIHRRGWNEHAVDNKKQTGSGEAEEPLISKSQDQDEGSGQATERRTSRGKANEDEGEQKEERRRSVNRMGEQEEGITGISDTLSGAINEQIRREDGTRLVSPDDLVNDQTTPAIINWLCPHSRLRASSALSDQLLDRRRGEQEEEEKGEGKGGLLRSDCTRSGTLSSLRSLLGQPSLPTSSCSLHAAHAFVRNFLIAFTGQTAVSLLMKAHLLIRDPVRVMRDTLLRDNRSLKLGLLVASFAALFKGSGCLIRAACRQHPNPGSRMLPDAKTVTLVSGLVAGSAMLFSPSSTAAQYMMWKLIETVYFNAAREGKVKYVEFTMNMLYAVSTAQLFYVAVMEPKMMRKSYTKWLNRMTRNTFGLLNRSVIDVFGTESSFGYTIPEFDFDVNHCSDKFKESVLVWMI